MLQLSIIFTSLFFLVGFSAEAPCAEERVRRVLTSRGVIHTPKGTAVKRVMDEGFVAIPDILEQQDKKLKSEREEETRRLEMQVRQEEDERRRRDLEALRIQQEQLRLLAQEESTRQIQAIEEARRQEEERRRLEQADHLRQLRENELQRIRERAEQDQRRQLEREQNERQLETVRQEAERQRLAELAMAEQIKEELIHQADERLSRERAAGARRMAESDRMIELLRRQNEESQREIAESERRLQEYKRHASAIAASGGEDMARRLHELQRAFDEEKAKNEALINQEAKAKIARLEEELREQKTIVSSFRTGQAQVMGKEDSFTSYGESPIHIQYLREPNTALDEERKSTFTFINDKLTALANKLTTLKLKGVGLQRAKTFLSNLQSEIDSGDESSFIATLREGKNTAQLSCPSVLKTSEFVDIENIAQWLEENKEELSRVGKHRQYATIQRQAHSLPPTVEGEFNDFCLEYFDTIIPMTCVWLSPTSTDLDGTASAKREVLGKLQTYTITSFLLELPKSAKGFGTTENFLTLTAARARKNREFDGLKAALGSYSQIFKNLPAEYARLVEDILNYQFFQRRFREAKADLATDNLDVIKDLTVRDLMNKIQKNDVLSFREAQTIEFAATVKKAIKDYLEKKAIDPKEAPLEPKIKKTLLAYQFLDYYGLKLREGNPKVQEFHYK